MTHPLNTPATPEQRWQESAPLYERLWTERTLTDLFGALRREVGE